MATTKIEWAEETWNPVTGCTKRSEGCRFCYAEMMAHRLKGMGKKKYKDGFALTLHEDELETPKHWMKPRRVFVCSMGDLFHEDVPDTYLDKVLEVIRVTPKHTYLLLTKRPDRMADYFQGKEIPVNVWLGTTVEAAEYKYRIDKIRKLGATVKFLSCEPLLNDLGDLDLTGIDWVIVGGESGGKAVRPMRAEWVMNIKEQADKQSTAFFFKQWGSYGSDGIWRQKKDNGCLLNGEIFQEYPHKLLGC